MSNYEQQPGRGSLFRVTKEGVEAVYDGSVTLLDGSECWLNVYKAKRRDGSLVTDKSGNQILNVVLKPKEPRQGGESSGGADWKNQTPSPPQDDDMEDEIPF